MAFRDKAKDWSDRAKIAYEHKRLEGGAWAIDATEVQWLQRLGAGAFGEVYLGKWRRSRVAIKKLLTHGKWQVGRDSIESLFSESK